MNRQIKSRQSRNRRSRAAAAAALLALTLTGTSAWAAMYKWVDAQGNVQYTQTPPPNQNAQVIKPPPPAPVSAEQAQKQLGQSREDLTPVPPPTADIEADKTQAEINRHNCEAARKNLDIYRRHRRVRNDKNKVVVLTDEQRAAKIKEAQAAIKKYCQQSQ
jgi:hypothetical protein